MKHFAFFLVLIIFILPVSNSQVAFHHVTVEHQDGSQPLATDQPRFSWNFSSEEDNVRQISYRIIVSSSAENARKGVGDLWDTQTIPSSKMLNIKYQGKTLHSRDIAFWKIQATLAYGNEGKTVTLESDVKSFEISLLNEEDWSAMWLGRPLDDDSLVQKTRIAARYYRKDFSLRNEVVKARLYICGLGQYTAFINGKEVAPEELLKPALSNYLKRVYFNAYDVTDMLKKGDNAMGVVLGGGRYFTMRFNEGEIEWGGQSHIQNYGTPRFFLQLEVTYPDGSTDRVISGANWRLSKDGPIRTTNEFDGETYDERLSLGRWTEPGYDDSQWLWGWAGYPPEGKLTPQPNPNIRVQDTLVPVAMFCKGDAWFLDMGQNMVGYLELQMRNLQLGDTVTLRFAETLNPDSTLFVANLREAEATDRYIANPAVGGQIVKWHPTFVYHGFRYVEITGLRDNPKIADFKGLVFYDEMRTTGEFETSEEIINAVYHNAYWGIRGNYRSMPTDCPQRDERMGWTGDRTTGNYGESYIFDNHRLYDKWLVDGEDGQWGNGSLSDVWPPYWRRYTDNMTWPGAFITVADMLYTRFGDDQPIRQHYHAMKRWMLLMKGKYSEDGIITRDTYGDWCMPPESPELVHSQDTTRITKAPLISTPFYCFLAGKMLQFAQLLGLSDDVDYFRKEIAVTTQSFNEKYLNKEKACYDNNTVTANILPLWFGMVPKDMEDKVFASIVDKTEKDFGGHVSTGVVGIQQLMRTLTEHGRGDLALKLATNDTYPSWGYMVRNGATTIWELWNGNTADPSMNSGNHVMLLGDLVLWYYEYLGGIRALEPGYSKIMLKPYPIKGLKFVNCAYESVSGRIESRWRRSGSRFEWDVTIPANTTAEVLVPTKKGYETKTCASGRYHFSSKL